MGSVGDAYDNAMAESYFSTEAELLSRRRFASQDEAKMACFSYIEGWYNPVRLHSGLGYDDDARPVDVDGAGRLGRVRARADSGPSGEGRERPKARGVKLGRKPKLTLHLWAPAARSWRTWVSTFWPSVETRA
jgi:hypothetical protein